MCLATDRLSTQTAVLCAWYARLLYLLAGWDVDVRRGVKQRARGSVVRLSLRGQLLLSSARPLIYPKKTQHRLRWIGVPESCPSREKEERGGKSGGSEEGKGKRKGAI